LATMGVLRLTHVLLHSPAPVPVQEQSESGEDDEEEEGAASEEGGGEGGEAQAVEAGAPAGKAAPAAGPVPAGRSPLFPLWTLMAVGALWQVLNTPATVLQVVWPVCLALAAWWIRRRVRSVEDGPERSMLRLSFWVLVVLTAAAVLDMAAMALVLSQAWFMLLAAIQILRLIRRGLHRLAAGKEAKGDGSHPGGRALRELVYPLAVAVMLYLYSVWALYYMGGPNFMRFVLRLDWTIGGVHLTFRGLGLILISFFAVRLILFLLRAGLESAGASGRRLDMAKAHTVSTVASYVVWVLFVLLALNILGVSMGALTWIASGLSVGVGFGLKDLVNNFISGIIVLFGGNIKKGDIIQTDAKTMGEVVNVSVRNTILRTLDNRTIIVPNQKFLSGEITNWSYKDKRLRLSLPVSVIPGTKIKKMEKILVKAAKKHKDVLEDPPPRVVSLGFGQLGLDFQLLFWIDDFHKKFAVETDLIAAIDEGFQEKKIIPAFRTVKKKYKPKGSEQMQLEARREALKEKRRNVYKLFRAGSRRHVRRRHGLTDSPVPRERGEE
ncbi:MAG: mechanosensitive ion channel family protein, partial [Desulfovibrionaceae bacterium]